MTNLQSPEWRDLQSNAMKFIESPELMKNCEAHRGFSRILRIWNYPSFDKFTSLSVFEQQNGRVSDSFIIIRTTWDRPTDAQRFTNPMIGLRHPLGFSDRPSVSLIEASCASPALRNSLDSLSKLTISPFFANATLSTDCDEEGIDFGRSQYRCLISFTGENGQNLKSLRKWKQSFSNIILNILP